MKIVVTGATGNVGTSVVRALSADASVTEIVAVARREPQKALGRSEFVRADVSSSDLEPIFRGADAVIHLAWLIQPGRDEAVTRKVNVDGSRRVFHAVVAAGVPALVYASSVGAYSPGPKDRFVDESWPTEGIESSFYSRHKAVVERDLDRLEAENPALRVVRLRPGLIFQRTAATEIRRLFVGPLLPSRLLRAGLAPISPDVRGLRARKVSISPRVLRAAASASYRLRLQPTEPGWLDMALAVPLMSTDRANGELGWRPTRTSLEAIQELVVGMREGADDQTPPLAAETGGPARVRELLTGVGRRP